MGTAMRRSKLLGIWIGAVMLTMLASVSVAAAAPAAQSSPADTSGAAPIAPGTEITVKNWQKYKHYMPDGMVTLFRGQYFFQMSDDVKIDVGPTLIRPLPKSYLDATDKYASQVKIVELGNGGLSLSGYKGGKPFPNLAEPHKGWKVLVNLWYRYLPHMIVDTYASACTQSNGGGSGNCGADEVVYRQLSYNTDPGIPVNTSGAEGKFYTEWAMTLEPEQDKYNATLTIAYADLTKPAETYAFVPALRRYLPAAAAGRCAQAGGRDATAEDYRVGFAGNLTQVQVDYAGAKQILALVDVDPAQGKYPEGFEEPLGWPRPEWGKWQLRDVDVISITKLPDYAGIYCYGKRVIYVDTQFAGALWEDLYDKDMKVWKFLGLFRKTLDVPGIGPVNESGSQATVFWDVQNRHWTVFTNPTVGRPIYLNEQAPKEYNDLARYTTPAGLNDIIH
jgi:hypothetical protein